MLRLGKDQLGSILAIFGVSRLSGGEGGWQIHSAKDPAKFGCVPYYFVHEVATRV